MRTRNLFIVRLAPTNMAHMATRRARAAAGCTSANSRSCQERKWLRSGGASRRTVPAIEDPYGLVFLGASQARPQIRV
jgi:hypothetical protein